MSDAERFWNYAVSVYERAREPCLALQDAYGFEVNLLLYCCWRGTLGMSLDEAAIRRITTACADWRSNVVEPLRSARRWMKGRDRPADAPLLRERIQGLELDAERLMQVLILEATGPASEPARAGAGGERDIARRNLTAYRSAMAMLETEGVESLIEALLAGVFAAGPDDDIVTPADGTQSADGQF